MSAPPPLPPGSWPTPTCWPRCAAGRPLSSSNRTITCSSATSSARCCPTAGRTGWALCPTFPLAGGFLTGKYQRGEPAPAGSRGESNRYVQGYMTEANYDVVERLTAWAEARDRGMNELAEAWLLAQPQVCSVIAGATRLEHVQANAQAADWRLTGDELAEVNVVLEG